MLDVRAFSLDISGVHPFVPEKDVAAHADLARAVGAEIARRQGPGSGFLGWLDLPLAARGPELDRLLDAAEKARGDSDLVVVIGIGGSYLGSAAVLSALADRASGPEIVFAGTDLCAVGLRRLLARTRGRDLRVCAISKSGTTLEPALAFRAFRRLLDERYGREGSRRRITAITDARRGALRALADAEGWDSYVIPDDVGGRFSVLTPVGLWPLAVAGLDVRRLLEGAADMATVCENPALEANPAHLYAVVRNLLLAAGYGIEVLSTFHGDLGPLQEWWKQLFAESEGKQGRGVFPAACRFTTDLHSLGQYLQDGRRELFETFLVVRETAPGITVPEASDDGDGLGWLAGRPLDEVNRQAYLGTRAAHAAGGVPTLAIEMARLDEWSLGGLLYFFEKAVAVSGRILGVNPFDQPGVEAYKREMFDRLGRP